MRSSIRTLATLAALLPCAALCADIASPGATEYVQALRSELSRYPAVRPSLAAKLILVESRGELDTPDGAAGEIGAMQIRPQTFAWVSTEILERNEHELNPRRPQDNLTVGIGLLNWLLERYDHNEELALIAYNAGMGSADRVQDEISRGVEPRIPATTRAYVETILGPGQVVGPPELLAIASNEIETPIQRPTPAMDARTCSVGDSSLECPPARDPGDASKMAVLVLLSYRRRVLESDPEPVQDASQGEPLDFAGDTPDPPLLS